MRRAKPEAIGDILSQVISRRGIGRVKATAALNDLWQEVVGEDFASFSRAGSLRRGTLEVLVSHSAIMQELAFRQHELLAQLNRKAPEHNISKLRFRQGAVD